MPVPTDDPVLQSPDSCYYDNVIRSDALSGWSTFAVLAAQVHSGMGWASRCFKFRVTSKRRMFITVADQSSHNGQFQELWYDGVLMVRGASPSSIWGCCPYTHCSGGPPPVLHDTIQCVLDLDPNIIHTIQVRFAGFDGISDQDIADNCSSNGNGGKMLWSWGTATCGAGQMSSVQNDPSTPLRASASASTPGSPGPSESGGVTGTSRYTTRTLVLHGQEAPYESRLRFAILGSTRVEARIYDVAGRLVRTIDLGLQPAGSHDIPWDATDNQGQRVAHGVYFARLVASTSGFTDFHAPTSPADGETPTPIMDLVDQIAPYVTYGAPSVPASPSVARASGIAQEQPIPQFINEQAAHDAGVSQEAIDFGKACIAVGNGLLIPTFTAVQSLFDFIDQHLLPGVGNTLYPCGSFLNFQPSTRWQCSNYYNISKLAVAAHLTHDLGYHHTWALATAHPDVDFTKQVDRAPCPDGSFRMQAVIRTASSQNCQPTGCDTCWTYWFEGPEPNPELLTYPVWPDPNAFAWAAYNLWWHKWYTDHTDVPPDPTCP